MKKHSNIGVIGLGGRGDYLVLQNAMPRDNVTISAVCDILEDRVVSYADQVEKETGKRPVTTTDWKEVMEVPNLDAIIITTGWVPHVEIAIAAMKKGIPVGMEIGGFFSVDQAWQLVHTYEETGTFFMLLENCCFGRIELMSLNMVKKGLLGKIVHATAGYCHDLRRQLAFGRENKHYRLDNYLCRNTDNYPMHALGPVAKCIDINRGNRMLALTAMASGAYGMNEYCAKERGAGDALARARFNQGDVIHTTIRCANGETITMTLATTTPRNYSRLFSVWGTKGMVNEENKSVFLDERDHCENFTTGNLEESYKEFDHPIWKKFTTEGVKGGHGGMDWLMFDAFFYCLENDLPAPIDVYDAAAWLALTPLIEDSIAMGGAPVAIPDFTNGKWMNREPAVAHPHSLDLIVE
ncbi:MAG: Gfo/Idh/MocA family oxidoreductase [Clostridia bacterium]|nr:Gfo/Idh/MocA family oxidoreductase [Clostridia bacterium]